jgi:hypothetical protein
MEPIKTAVEITQELLALVATRHERLQQPGARKRDEPGYSPEKDKMVRLLLDELSLYGDDVNSSVDKSDPYFKTEVHDEKLFREAVMRLRKEAGEIPESLERIFEMLFDEFKLSNGKK